MTRDQFRAEQERLRGHLRENGWTDWREEDAREPGLLEHGVHLFTPDHERGPLVIWRHPDVCECEVPA